ncbi:MAG: hypothetical protein WC529_06380 [Candidatus Margulisiibacteriota bacterium]
MKKRLRHLGYLALLAGLFMTLGCAQVPLATTNYEPQVDQPGLKSVVIGNDTFAEYTLPDCRITSAIFEFNNVIAVSLEIRNLTGQDLGVKEYAVSLADGRDLKPVKMLTRQDLVATRAKMSGGTGGAIQDQLIQATVDTIMNTMNTPTKEKLIKIIDQGIAEYFDFRPVYANDRRGGVLCFVPDFQLEYPLTLTVKIKGEPHIIKFLPQVKKDV